MFYQQGPYSFPVPNTTPSEASPTARIAQINYEKTRLEIEKGLLLEKALGSDNPDEIIKASLQWQDVKTSKDSEIKSVLINPDDITGQLGYKTKWSSVSFNLLRQMAKTPIIRAIITTRQAQVANFAKPQKSRFEPGFVIRKKNLYYTDDADLKVSPQDKKFIQYLTNFILNCGSFENSWHGDNFDVFLKKIVNDSLALDQGCFEVVRNLKGTPTEFLAVDGATIRLKDTAEAQNTHSQAQYLGKPFRGYYASHVQVWNGQPVNEYYPWELCFGVRNSTSDILQNGYGESELESLIRIVTWMLYGDEYNGKFFTQGSNPKGLLKVSGNVNRNRIEEFRQSWLSMVTGVQNAWKVPIIESDQMEWIDLQHSNADMQFSNWQDYLVKIACAVYKISPEEIGFKTESTGGGSGTNFESNQEKKLKYSRDKGLKPLLTSIEAWINKWLIAPHDPEFEFVFVGMDVGGEDQELDLDIKRVGAFVTINEVRAKWGYPKIEGGDNINSMVYLQAKSQEQQKKMQEEGQASMEEEEPEDDSYSEAWGNLEKAELTDDPFLNDLNSFWKSNILGE